jgi:hypothetical protein
MMHGVRFEPSSEVNSEPRHGPANPFHWPPRGSGSLAGARYVESGPLSDAHTTIVSPATPSASNSSRIRPVKSSIWVRMSAQLPRLVLPTYSGSGMGGMCTWV